MTRARAFKMLRSPYLSPRRRRWPRIVPPPALDLVIGGGAFSIECDRHRKVVRVVSDIGACDVALASGQGHRGLAAAEVVSVGRFWLLAGTATQGTGSPRDLAATFVDEADGRDAFRSIRVAAAYRAGWAELAGLDTDGHLLPLCWFGHRSPLTRLGTLAPGSTTASAGRRALRPAG